MVVEDTETGRLEIQRGPLLYVPGIPPVVCGWDSSRTAHTRTHARTHTPTAAGPYDKVGPVKRAISLDVTQYIVVHSLVDGSLRNELGPAMYVPGAYDVRPWGVSRVAWDAVCARHCCR